MGTSSTLEKRRTSTARSTDWLTRELRDLPTELLLKFVSVQDNPFGEYDKQGDKG